MPHSAPLLPGTLYHVYNRGVGRETVFRTDGHYRLFLRLLAHHVVPSAHVFAFALLPNHFHLVLRPRDAAARPASQALSNACNAYARTFNRATGRAGTLFARPFQRKPVLSRAYAAALVRYVHDNPVRHGLVGGAGEWPYTSLPLLASHAPTRLERREVLSWHDDEVVAPTLDADAALVDGAFEALVDALHAAQRLPPHLSGRET